MPFILQVLDGLRNGVGGITSAIVILESHMVESGRLDVWSMKVVVVQVLRVTLWKRP